MKDLNSIKNSKYLEKFIHDNNISDETIKENLSLFSRVIESQEACLDCKGLDFCKQRTNGQRLNLSYPGTIVEEIEFCKYAQKNIDKSDLASNYVYCDIADNLLNITLDNITYTEDQKELYALLLGILHKKTNKGLYILGDLGVGKTYLCTALANSLVNKGEKVAFVKAGSFFNKMKANLVSNSQLVDKTINRLKKVDYLIIDDIGSESVSQFVRDDILLIILDYRMDHDLITIFNSNLDKDSLYKHFQYDRHEKSNMKKAERLLERIDVLTDDYVLIGKNMRRQ